MFLEEQQPLQPGIHALLIQIRAMYTPEHSALILQVQLKQVPSTKIRADFLFRQLLQNIRSENPLS